MIKIKSISKRVLAVLLATLMLLTSGIVGTLAANVELAETGATTVRIYCEDNWNWNGLKIYYWGGSSPVSNWDSSPSMKDTGEKILQLFPGSCFFSALQHPEDPPFFQIGGEVDREDRLSAGIEQSCRRRGKLHDRRAGDPVIGKEQLARLTVFIYSKCLHFT